MVVLAFKVAGFLCALRTEHVEEVIALPATVKIPGQPTIVEGFLNLRGRMIAVVRTAVLFQAAPHSSWNSHVILIKAQNGITGFLVDHVATVISVDDAVRPVESGHTLTEFAQGELTAEGESAVLLDAARLLLAEEQTRIRQLQAELEHRRMAVEVPVE